MYKTKISFRSIYYITKIIALPVITVEVSQNVAVRNVYAKINFQYLMNKNLLFIEIYICLCHN